MACAGIQWGTVGEWVSGVGGLLAAGTAIWVVLTDRRRQRQDRLARVQQEVAAMELELSGPSRFTTSSQVEFRGRLTNALTLPIYDVRVSLLWPDGLSAQCVTHGSMAANSQLSLEIVGPTGATLEDFTGDLIGSVVEFSDSEARRWRRDFTTNEIECLGRSKSRQVGVGRQTSSKS